MRKEVKQVIELAEDYGFTCIGIAGSGHWTLQHTSGAKVTVPGSPKRGRWRQNALADIKRVHRNNPKGKS